jgi:BirA family biotin operon repressor/biotin-[acetyl-CoA-carboxylase] ligase
MGIRAGRFGSVFLSFSEIGSTNSLLVDLAAQGYPEGTVAQADSQTQGRGRQGRSWITPRGKALAFSVLLRPRLHPKELPLLTLMAAVAVSRALESYHLKPGIKWPNDILLGGKKLCGILTEAGPSRDNKPSIILGLGLNVNQTPKDFPTSLRKTAASLRTITKKEWDRERLLGTILDHLEEEYEALLQGRLSRLIDQWTRRNVTLGREIRVHQGRKVSKGTAVGLDRSGALLLRLENGETQKVFSGDVVPLRKKGNENS